MSYDLDVFTSGGGLRYNGTAGETLTAYQVVYGAGDGRWYLADADVATSVPLMGLTMDPATAGQKCRILIKGVVCNMAWTWSEGQELYLSQTAGEMTQTAPTLPARTQVVGAAITSNIIWFEVENAGLGGGATGCALLEGATAFVGFDDCKEPYTNYFLCDGVADAVQIQDAIDYVEALGGGEVKIEAGTYIDVAVTVSADYVTLHGCGKDTVLTLPATDLVNIVSVTSADHCYIKDIAFNGNKANAGATPDHKSTNAIYAYNSDYLMVSGCYFYDVISHSVAMFTGSDYGVCTKCQFYNCDYYSWVMHDSSDYCVCEDCVFVSSEGPEISTNCYGGVLNGLSIYDAYGRGFRIMSPNNIISDCVIQGGARGLGTGVLLEGADNNIVSNIHISGTVTIAGIRCYSDSNNNLIQGCIIDGVGDGATDAGIKIDGDGDNNVIINNTVVNGSGWGVDIDSGATGNKVMYNTFRNNASGHIIDDGAGTILSSKPFQFTDVTGGSATVQLSSPVGCYVYDANATAIVWGQLPSEIQQVVRLKVWAVAKDAPVNAGGQMHCEFTFNAGASNAAYNTAGKSWNITNKDSVEADYVANDIVHWVLTDADTGDSEISALVAGDSFELLAIYESAADPDGDTDAKFRVVEVEYV